MNPVTLPENIISVINVVLLAMLVIFALIGYLRGFVSQFYDVLVMLIGYLLALLIAPSLARSVKLLPASVNFNEIPFIGAQMVSLIDQLIWTLIIVFIMIIIGAIFKRILIRKVLRYRHVIVPDRIGGAVFAIIPVLLIGFVTALMLSTPLFTNGSTVLNATILRPLAPSTTKLIETVITNNPTIQLYDKVTNGEPLEETDFETIRQTLIDMGFPQNVIDVAMKFVKHETITDEDIQVLKTYAQDNNLSKETIMGWLKDFGFTDAQIQDLMEKYN